MTMKQHIPIILLIIGGCILTVWDIFMKKWVITNEKIIFAIWLAIYLVAMVFLSLSYRYKNIAVASTMLVIFNIITLAIVSWLYFKEALTPMQLIGIGLGIELQ